MARSSMDLGSQRTFTPAQLDKAFEIIDFPYQNMTYNSTCDDIPFAHKAKADMSTLQVYMMNWCMKNLEEL